MGIQLEAGDLRTFRVVVVGGDADNIKGTERAASAHFCSIAHTRVGSVGDAKSRLSDNGRKNTRQFHATYVSEQILTLYSRAEKGNL